MTVDVKRIVCLANSRKYNGRCIAGKEVISDGRLGGWIRPVSARETGEVAPNECGYQDGNSPRVLDIIDVPVTEAQPGGYQQENWLLAPNLNWMKVGRFNASELTPFIDTEEDLWPDGYSSSYGENDRVPSMLANSLRDSLRLIRVERLEISPETVYANNRRRLRGHFRHADQDYSLIITDTFYENEFFSAPPLSGYTGERLLTVSLGEQFESYGYTYSYKLIAAVIEP